MPSLDWDDYRSDPSFVNDAPFSPNLDRFNTPLNSSFDVNNLNLSSDTTASDVVNLHSGVVTDAPPPLPPRRARSQSVIVCSKNTCKPRGRTAVIVNVAPLTEILAV